MRSTEVKDLTNDTHWLVAEPGIELSFPALLSLNHTLSQLPGSKVCCMWLLLKETKS